MTVVVVRKAEAAMMEAATVMIHWPAAEAAAMIAANMHAAAVHAATVMHAASHMTATAHMAAATHVAAAAHVTAAAAMPATADQSDEAVVRCGRHSRIERRTHR
jgi:hypothetical protein